MAQISSYPLLTPQLGDSLLGSNIVDSAGAPVIGNPTVQYSISSVKSVVDQAFTQQLTSQSSLAAQDATAAATNISFGALQDLSNVKLDASGILTIKTIGTYYITLDYIYGQRTATANVTTILFNVLQNGIQLGNTTSIRFQDNDISQGTSVSIPIMVTTTLPDTVYNFQLAETDTGAQLVRLTNSVTGFANSPCAAITISKLI
tara:strand:- start:483 stop:1094 length:612 start_codon:yes stop_codon:yes gene_type:complete